MDTNVPLIVPEINPEDIQNHKGIISNPNCTAIITLMAIFPIHKVSQITRVVASSYQAVSGAGKEGQDELRIQTEGYVSGVSPDVKVFRHQIFNNVIPQVDDFTENGYTVEEMKTANESKKILRAPELKISFTCVRVPVVRCHSVSVMIETKDTITAEHAARLIRESPGLELADDPAAGVYPMPISSEGRDTVSVGRIRGDISGNGLNLWCCGDQLRKGAATNAVQIAELIVFGMK
jgi:aspartate-semialdehyde dehydrogenase